MNREMLYNNLELHAGPKIINRVNVGLINQLFTEIVNLAIQ